MNPAHRVLVFAEHDPTPVELSLVVSELERHTDATVSVVLHHNPVPRQERVDEHGGATHDHLEQLVGHPRVAAVAQQIPVYAALVPRVQRVERRRGARAVGEHQRLVGVLCRGHHPRV